MSDNTYRFILVLDDTSEILLQEDDEETFKFEAAQLIEVNNWDIDDVGLYERAFTVNRSINIHRERK